MGKLLELQEISKQFAQDEILSGISVTVEKGAALAITGDSGGGKTTLLSIMGLLQQATSGRILVDGEDVSGWDAANKAALRGRYFGFVFQRARLVHSLTALENVLLPAWFLQKGRRLEQRAAALMARFGMSHRLQHKPQELSLGQLRRVSLARALLLQPAVLLADEPTNDLDPVLAAEIADCLLEARETGAGVVIVTHDPLLAARADRVLRLNNGKLDPAS
ncbi:MAG TPA: ABC transporter ATP-binding protein [Firmicutes bacterium]|nr:ABC transporter ATP-binding protein [Bacillota bacterium]HWR55947.1 ABC transporter ATP-binding protein [Negativicutes bacterium]